MESECKSCNDTGVILKNKRIERVCYQCDKFIEHASDVRVRLFKMTQRYQG